MAEQSWCCSPDTAVVLSCSGGSNVGQIANEVTKRLEMAGLAKFFCLAGIGGHISGMVASVKGAQRVLVIDGCPVACAKKCMEEADLKGYEYLVVTELGIEKNRNFSLPASDIEKTMIAATEKLNASLRPARS